MTYLLTAVLCSVLVSVLLKLFPRHGIDTAQAVTWNYLLAAVLCAWLLRPDLASLRSPDAPWPTLLALAVILPGLFLILAAAVRRAGIVRTDVAQRLSLLLSLVAAFFWFGEPAGGRSWPDWPWAWWRCWRSWHGPGTPAGPAGAGNPAVGAGLALLCVWVGFAWSTCCSSWSPGRHPFAASLQVAFAGAFAGMLGLQLWRHHRRARLAWRHVAAGLLLGTFNFGNIVCYVRAHQALPEARQWCSPR